MTPSTITTAVQLNSRQQEAAVRDAEQALSRARDRTLKLEQQILDRLSEIAAIQLESPQLCSKEVAKVLDQRQLAEMALRTELNTIEVSISELTDMERQMRASLDALNSSVNRALSADETYLQLVDLKVDAANAAKLYDASRVEIKSECAGKMAGYQQPVFQYLLAAKFGTSEYRSRYLVRMLEGWLAEKSNFMVNAMNYRMLGEMQTSVDARFRELRAKFDEADQNLLARVESARAAAGIPELQGKLDAVRGQVENGKRNANTMHTSLGKFASGDDQHTKRAETLMLQSLKARSFEDIQELVTRSASTRDDTAAGELRFLNQELDAHLRKLPGLDSTLKAASAAYSRAKELERMLRRDSYTSSRYRYRDGLDLDALILGYMAGTISSSRVEDRVRDAQETIRRDDNDSFGGGLGSGSIFSTSGSSGGGSFSSGSSIGGGGFSTGDSF